MLIRGVDGGRAVDGSEGDNIAGSIGGYGTTAAVIISLVNPDVLSSD